MLLLSLGGKLRVKASTSIISSLFANISIFPNVMPYFPLYAFVRFGPTFLNVCTLCELSTAPSLIGHTFEKMDSYKCIKTQSSSNKILSARSIALWKRDEQFSWAPNCCKDQLQHSIVIDCALSSGVANSLNQTIYFF